MTEKRKNEIWRGLPEDFKKEVKELWELDTLPVHPDYNMDSVTEGAAYILVELFGKHNLTAQAEERPNEPKFKIGDKVVVNGKFISEIYDIDIKGYPEYPYHIQKQDGYYGYFAECDLAPYTEPKEEENREDISSNGENCEIPTKNSISDSKIQSESAESVEISQNSQTNSQSADHIPDTTKMVDYAQYRLDLTKEIAVAMVATDRIDIAKNSVAIANEIVKRLKETEI